MKEHVKDLWVAALRSGEYDQSVSVLQDEFGYCCLGVLCEVGKKHGVKLIKRTGDSFLGAIYGSDLIYGGDLSDQDEVEKWSGVAEDEHLVRMNDDLGKGFDEIADYIDQNWKSL